MPALTTTSRAGKTLKSVTIRETVRVHFHWVTTRHRWQLWQLLCCVICIPAAPPTVQY